MMVSDHQYDNLGKFRSALSIFVYPIQYAVNIPVMLIDRGSLVLMTRAELMEENNRLHNQQLLLNLKIQRFDILQAENNRLREMLKSSKKFDDKVLIAELVAIDLKSFSHQVVINKGQRQGVYQGQAIVDANGVMGQIVSVGPFFSTALLLTDPRHAIPVQVNRNGLRAIAVGTGQSHILQLQHLPSNADIQEGDLIISSGLGNRFPPGYPIGTVNSIDAVVGEHFLRVTIIPSAQLVKSREVLLVWPHGSDLPSANRPLEITDN